MAHICVGKLTIIGSDNDLLPERRQAIIWTNAGILLIGPLGTNLSEILIEIQTFSLKKIRLKMLSAKCCSFRLGLNVLMLHMCIKSPSVLMKCKWNKIPLWWDIFFKSQKTIPEPPTRMSCVSSKYNIHCLNAIDQSHRYGRPQAACREPAGSYDKTTRTALCFEHKTQYLLIRAPYTRIVVFWHISNIPPMILQSQISCITPTFYIAAIFVKYCYTTGSWLL